MDLREKKIFRYVGDYEHFLAAREGEAERLLSDHRYATQRVVARAGRYGDSRLRQELRQNGVSDDDISAALPEGGDETQRCRAVWARPSSASVMRCWTRTGWWHCPAW